MLTFEMKSGHDNDLRPESEQVLPVGQVDEGRERLKKRLYIRWSAWSIIRAAREKGHVVSMTQEVERNRTPMNEKLSEYFKSQCPGYDGIFDGEDGEWVLERINDYLLEKNIEMGPLDFPLGGGVDVFLVPIGRNILLKVLVVDEYYGDGEYSKYVEVPSFIMNERTSFEDVVELVNFVQRYLHTGGMETEEWNRS